MALSPKGRDLPEGFGPPFGAFRVGSGEPDMVYVEQKADLVIVGGGYMAINCFNAAVHHLRPGATVSVMITFSPNPRGMAATKLFEALCLLSSPRVGWRGV
jgi:hypothetical protein